ncbi:hypothetical protein ES706_00020 [subsurface metagenome]|nr:hypothetical protein [Hadesarchaea archaeon]
MEEYVGICPNCNELLSRKLFLEEMKGQKDTEGFLRLMGFFGGSAIFLDDIKDFLKFDRLHHWQIGAIITLASILLPSPENVTVKCPKCKINLGMSIKKLLEKGQVGK